MMRAVDPRSSAGQMSAWSDALGFLPPYLCPAHGEAPAGYRLYVTAADGDDAVLLDALSAVLTDADVPRFDFGVLGRLRTRLALLSWPCSADAVRAHGAFEARQQPRGDLARAVRWWIPRGYDPWVHDPRFAGAPRLAAVEGPDDAAEGRGDQAENL